MFNNQLDLDICWHVQAAGLLLTWKTIMQLSCGSTPSTSSWRQGSRVGMTENNHAGPCLMPIQESLDIQLQLIMVVLSVTGHTCAYTTRMRSVAPLGAVAVSSLSWSAAASLTFCTKDARTLNINILNGIHVDPDSASRAFSKHTLQSSLTVRLADALPHKLLQACCRYSGYGVVM